MLTSGEEKCASTGEARSGEDSLQKHDCRARDGRKYGWRLQRKNF